jgi:hypothetical protein
MNGFTLPKGEGFYLKRGVIYLALYLDGKKRTYSTGWMLNEPGLKRKLDDFKKAKIGEAAIDEQHPSTKRGVRMERVFTNYLEHLRIKEKEKGDYTTEERTTSDRNEGFIENHLGPFFSKLKPEEVDATNKAYRKLREDEGVSAATVNGEFRVLRAAMNRGWKDNLIREADLPKEYPFNYIGEKLNPRTKEPRWIKRADVVLNDDAPRINVYQHKTLRKIGKPKVVALVDDLLPFILEWKKRSEREFPKCEWFFNTDGNRIDADRLETAWEQCRVACGIPQGVMMYDARRTHRGLLDDNDVLKDDAKDQMGQVTDAMSDLYKNSHAHVNRIRAAFSKKKGTQTDSAPEPIAPVTPVLDRKAALAELKELNDAGLLPENIYHAEIAKVMASR